MPACERFAADGSFLFNNNNSNQIAETQLPNCKKNTRRWCQSDLGAVALNWGRLISENRSFGDLRSEERGLDAEHADGLMMEALAADGWEVCHVSDSCLFVHSPSIQSCAWSGGVWDDRDLIINPGGKCITEEEANEILAEATDANVEEVIIAVSNDGDVERLYINASQVRLDAVRCLRQRNSHSKDVWGLTMLWYSEHCVDDFDMVSFKNKLNEFFPTEEALERARELAQAHADASALIV